MCTQTLCWLEFLTLCGRHFREKGNKTTHKLIATSLEEPIYLLTYYIEIDLPKIPVIGSSGTRRIFFPFRNKNSIKNLPLIIEKLSNSIRKNLQGKIFKNRVFNKLVDHQRFRVIYDSSQSPQSQGGTTTTAVVFLQTLALTRDFNFATFRQNAFLLLQYFLQKKSKNTQKTHSIIMGICIYILVKELYY